MAQTTDASQAEYTHTHTRMRHTQTHTHTHKVTHCTLARTLSFDSEPLDRPKPDLKQKALEGLGDVK